MTPAAVIFAPEVDRVFLELIDYVDPSELPDVLAFIEAIETRLVTTLSTFPEGGNRFQGRVRMFAIERYTFLYEYHPDVHEVHVLEVQPPKRNWR
jgi:hypothetical protein